MRSVTLAAFVLLSSVAVLPATGPRPSFGEPSVSPTGTEIAFVSGGDIWTVAAAGGEAHLLVSHPATESRPLYSPDGTSIAFTSTRTGSGDVYILNLVSGDLRRLTYDDANELVDGWSRDSKWIYFTSGAKDIGTTDIYRVSAEGGTPMLVTAERYTTEYYAAPSPDGQTLAFVGHGNAGVQWWRKGHSHLDESEIWLRRETGTYERVTEPGAKEAWPMWSRDGRSLFYMSDRSGAQNLWQKALGGRPTQMTKFVDGRVLWPSISADGRTIVFERDFRVWKLDVQSGRTAAIEVVRRGTPSGPVVQHVTLAGQFRALSLAPDGKKVAFVSHGEVFAANAKEASDAARLTRSAGAESQLVWSPDSRKVVYVSERTGTPVIFEYDFTTSQERQLTTIGPDSTPAFSPDGKRLAFVRDARDLRVLDVESKAERSVVSAHFNPPAFADGPPFVWSPDNQWLAYFDVTGKNFSNLWIVPGAGGAPQQVSYLSNWASGTVVWSPDGKYLLYNTRQRTEPGRVAQVDLTPRTPRFREDQFQELFRETPKEAPKAVDAKGPVAVTFEGIRRRLSLLPIGLDADSLQISPDGKWLVLVGSSAGQENLYSYSLDELAREAPVARQLTATAGNKSGVHFTPDSKEVYYLDRGGVWVVALDSRQPRQIPITAEMDLDFSSEKMEVFHQAWTGIRDYFFDAKYNGVDWKAVRELYDPLLAGAATPDEMRRLLSLMVGELNASHLGVNPPAGSAPVTTGRIGVRFDRTAYEGAGQFKVAEVLPLGPAAVAGLKTGDVILAVDGTALTARSNFESLFEYKVGRRVSLRCSDRDIQVLPVNLVTERNLLYRAWVDANREYVAKTSGGTLGYVHMRDMSADALDQLYIDLDAENHSRRGVVIDIRNNNGGFVNVYALDVFSRKPYLKLTARGFDEAPARSVLGQRSLEAPTILVTNQHSLSDAEDFTEGYRTLKLGKVVGEPTAGWIIYTSNVALLDGTIFRLPGWRVRGAAGDDMELHPRQVDIFVSRPFGEAGTGKDSQLDAAVRELLAEFKTVSRN